MKLFSLIIYSFIIFPVYGEEKCLQEKITWDHVNDRLERADRNLYKASDTLNKLKITIIDAFQNKWGRAGRDLVEAQSSLDRAIKNDTSEENEQKVREATETVRKASSDAEQATAALEQATIEFKRTIRTYHNPALKQFSDAGLFAIEKKREYDNCMSQ